MIQRYFYHSEIIKHCRGRGNLQKDIVAEIEKEWVTAVVMLVHTTPKAEAGRPVQFEKSQGYKASSRLDWATE